METEGRQNLDIKCDITRRSVLKGALAAGAASLLGGPLSAAEAVASPGVVREYWIQADSFERNLIPSKRDDLMGRLWLPEDSTYHAVGFRAYTPGWRQLLPAGKDIGDNSGIPGPVIRGHPGDKIIIHFRNNDTHYGFPHSMHVHGLLYTPENDGAWTYSNANTPGVAVRPGEKYTYRYTALPSSVGTWVYHDHSIPQSLTGGPAVMEMSTELGMFGLIAIEDPKAPPADQEIFLFFHQLYAADIPALAQDFACFNGHAFCPNTPVFHARNGERVRWRIGALGQEFYVFHLHGHRWLANGEYADTAIIGPATTATIEYVEDNPGHWFYHCQIPAHIQSGMIGQYVVDG